MSKEIDHNRPRFLGPAVSREHSPTVATDILEIGYETGGPYDGPLVLLLHGWPDDVRGWRGVVPHLEQAGFRWVAPWLRGFGHTRFLSGDTIRDGSAVALAQDAIDLVDHRRLPAHDSRWSRTLSNARGAERSRERCLIAPGGIRLIRNVPKQSKKK